MNRTTAGTSQQTHYNFNDLSVYLDDPGHRPRTHEEVLAAEQIRAAEPAPAQTLQAAPQQSTKEKEKACFPVDAMPPAIGNYMQAVSENAHISVDMLGLPALSILSLCLLGKIAIAHPNGAGHIEEPMLYTLTIAPPSSRKSGALRKLMQPLQEYQARYNREHKQDIQEYAAARDHYDRIQRTGDNIEKVKKAARDAADLKPVHKITLNITDTTPESLAAEMSKNNGKMGIMDGEGGVFDTISGLYAKGGSGNIDIFLKAYDGEPHTITRRTSENIELQAPRLAIGILTQQAQYAKITANEQFAGRGLLQRMLVAFPAEVKDDFYAKPISSETAEAYSNCIQNLLKLDQGAEPRILLFDKDAINLFTDYWFSLDRKKRDKANFIRGQAAEWYGKHYGRALRIAGILHLASGASCSDQINGTTAHHAIMIAKWAESQYMNSLENIKGDRVTECAARIYRKLKGKGAADITQTMITQAVNHFADAETVQSALDLMTENGIFEELEPEPRKGAGRPPKTKYRLCPPHKENAEKLFFQ